MSRKNYIPRVSALGSKLKNLLPNVNTNRNKTKDIRDPLPAPTGVDGVDHINIWDRGATDIGQALAHSTAISFVHKECARFSSMESFWHYVRSEEREDRLRGMVGRPLKIFAQKLTQRRVVNFKALIMDANWQKVCQYPEIKEAIKASTLPFECYYIYRREDGIRIRPSFSHWLIRGFNEIRSALLEDREANFDFLKDDPEQSIYASITVKNDSQNDVKSSETETTSGSTASGMVQQLVNAANAVEAEQNVSANEQ